MELRDEDFDNVNPGEPRILIEEGLWPAEFVRKEKMPSRWGEKLCLFWKVYLSCDKSRFIVLPRFYNLQRDGGGRLMFGHLHAYRRDWIVANHGKLPLDPKRLRPTVFEKGLCVVEVVTVRNSNDRALHPSLHWSRIGWIIRPMDEGESWEGLPLQPLDSSSESD